MSAAASSNSRRRATCVATIVPLPGSESPSASVRQFIELAVNIPEHDPQPGQAQRSMRAASSSLQRSSAPITIASIRSTSRSPKRPASIGPPETKTVGMLSRMAAISIPGVILSHLLMHTSASMQWALAMYSTLSAMISREGSE